MKRIGQLIETTMVSLAFTDVGEFETARLLIEKGPQIEIARFFRRLERDLITITFAESGCY